MMNRPSARSTIEPYSRFVFDNGFRLIVKENHFAPIACVSIWVGAGVVIEDPEKMGISHFFEHMFFKGTEKRGVGEMDREVAALGGHNNAATSLDYTEYYVTLPSERYDFAIELLTDALLHSTFDEEEIERERMVILEEIHRQEDSPFGKLHDEFMRASFQDSPYGRLILGTEETLGNIRRADFLDYFRREYRPDNLILVVCGDVETEEVLDLARGLYGGLPAGCPRAATVGDEGVRPRPTEFEIRKDVQQAYLLAGYPTPNIGNTAHEYALDVASAILGWGWSSRLYRSLREERGLVSSVDANFSLHRSVGLFCLDAVMSEEDLPEVEEAFLRELGSLRRGDFSDEEIERAKNILVGDFILGNEKNSAMADTLAMYELFSRIEDGVEYVPRIRRVTRDDVVAALEEHCPEGKWTKGVALGED